MPGKRPNLRSSSSELVRSIASASASVSSTEPDEGLGAEGGTLNAGLLERFAGRRRDVRLIFVF